MPYVAMNTVGLAIIIETGQPIAGASNINLNVKKPSGEKEIWTGAAVYGETALRYVTVAGDLDEAGPYVLYPELTLGDYTGKGKPDRFLISDPEKPDKRYGI